MASSMADGLACSIVAAVGIAGDVPAARNIIGLARVIEIAAAGRAFDRKTAFAGRQLVAVGVEDRGDVAGDGGASAAGADGVAAGGDEDVHQLRRADAVDDRDIGAVLPRLPHRLGEMFAG